MARTLSVTDDESGITASMRIEDVDGQSRITKLHFDAADGFGITSEHLRLLQDLGLQLPAALSAAPSAPRAATSVPTPRAPERVPARKVAKSAPRTADRATRYAGGPPSDPALQSMFTRFDGSPRKIAESMGCSPASVNGWLKAARARGIVFSTNDADVLATP